MEFREWIVQRSFDRGPITQLLVLSDGTTPEAIISKLVAEEMKQRAEDLIGKPLPDDCYLVSVPIAEAARALVEYWFEYLIPLATQEVCDQSSQTKKGRSRHA